ncbi:MAG TPA: fructose-bisphosphate aldolase [Chloroflexia bacterium]|nr:fructose-bisphosphate aldolase [Chloroflexia bacterium]
METLEKSGTQQSAGDKNGSQPATEKVTRPRLEDLDLPTGKKARLHRLMYEHGPGNGTMMLLPIDQGLEHGPIDFLINPPALDPEFQLKLAVEGGFSGIVFHIGLATKYMNKYAGKVPLVLKVNGKTNIPSDAQPFSTLDATVEDAVRLGADGVGYTLYVGSPRQDQDILQMNHVRQECEKYGMPLIVWAYPRGEAVKTKGGNDSLYAVDYAARLALELGADVVKLNVPDYEKSSPDQPKPYNTMELGYAGVVSKVVASAGRALVLFSGGSKVSDEDLMLKARTTMENGATGLIFGRNLWQRPMNEALEISEKLLQLMRSV